MKVGFCGSNEGKIGKIVRVDLSSETLLHLLLLQCQGHPVELIMEKRFPVPASLYEIIEICVEVESLKNLHRNDFLP